MHGTPLRLSSAYVQRLAEALRITGHFDFPDDFMDGISAYGELYVADNLTSQTLTLQNTWYKWTTAWVAGESHGTTPSVANGNIVIDTAGVYRVTFCFTADVSGAAQVLEVAVFKNNTYLPDHSMHVSMQSTFGNAGATSGILTCAAGDIIDVRIQNTTSANRTLVIEDGNLSCSTIPGA